MRFYFDLNLGKLVSLPGYAGVLTTAEFKRGDEAEIEVQFCRGSVLQSLEGTVSEMIFVAKLNFLNGTAALLLANTWTHDAISQIYSAPLTQAGDLSTVLGTLAFKDLVGEFTFTTSGGGPSTSQTIVARVTNDVWKGTEGTPLEFPTAAEWLAAQRAAVSYLEPDPNRATDGTVRAVSGGDNTGELIRTSADFNPSSILWSTDGTNTPPPTGSWWECYYDIGSWVFQNYVDGVAGLVFVSGNLPDWPEEADWSAFGGTVTRTSDPYPATHTGVLLVNSVAWWIWNGTAWIPFMTLDGSPIAYNATLAAYRKITLSGAIGAESLAYSAL